jgi:hypothetical protein
VQRPSQVQLEWTVSPGCPNVDDLRARLRDRLPTVEQPLSPGAVPLEVSASILSAAQGFEAHIELRNGESTDERRLSSRDCSLLTDAIVLVIAVALDPVTMAAHESQRREARGQASAPTTPRERPRDEVPADQLTDGPAESSPIEPIPESAPAAGELGVSLGSSDDATSIAFPLQVGLRALAGGGFGPTNSGFASLAGSVALIGARWRVVIDGRWVVRRSVVRDGGAGGRFDAWLVGAVGCYVPGPAKLELPVCAGVEAGQVRGEGVPTLAVIDRAAIPHVALRLAPGITWVPIERLAIGFDLELAAPLTRGEFVVDAIVVQRVVPAAVRGMLGIEIRLP